MHDLLATFGGVSALEIDEQASKQASQKGYERVYSNSHDALARTYDLIALFDVLEHIEDDAAFLHQANSALTPEGRVVLTVPAMPFLWSAHDVSHHHFRRYTKQTLCSVLESAGFAVEYVSYWNFCLFIPAAVARLLGRAGEDSLRLPSSLNLLFLWVVKLEVFCMRFVPLPWGVSLVVVGKCTEPSA
jgi:SAM-dependent methyltransferase